MESDPTLEYFRISKEYGFLNKSDPTRIPELYPKLQSVINNLTTHIKDHSLESEIKLIDINISIEYSDEEYYELYTILSIIVSGYIWELGEKLNRTNIPHNIAEPLLICSKHLGLKPFITHTALDLNNWQLINPNLPFDLDNIKTRYTFTNTESESWFYLVMITIEQAGAQLVNYVVTSYDDMINAIPTDVNSSHDNIHNVLHDIYVSEDGTSANAHNSYKPIDIIPMLRLIYITLKNITNILNRMYEKCDRKHFYQTQRIFLTGSTNKSLFPNGLNYQLSNGSSEKIIVSGGSAAQSTLIQMIDVILGIKHTNNFLNDMRDYMPRWHRQLLIWLESTESIIDIINRCPDKIKYLIKYNKCVKLLDKFRAKHIAMVNYYVIKNPIAELTPSVIAHEGTGGSNIHDLLSEYKKDTKDKTF